MGTRLLLVEDDDAIADLVQLHLGEAGYEVQREADGAVAMRAIDRQDFAMVLLDLMLPGADGWDVCRHLRERPAYVPLIIVSARSAEVHRVLGLELGADDYLAKPFSILELVARVRALLRRSTLRDEELLLRVGTLQLDTVSREVTRDGAAISLTQKEYALLEYLMRHSGRAVTREQIAEHVWKTEFDPSTNIVDVYINYLRKKIDGTDGPQLLHTVRGTGYMLRT